MSFMRTAAGVSLASLGCLIASALHAQAAATTGDLVTFALDDPTATTLQRNSAIAVQGMCTDLRTSGASLTAATPTGDLYRRCNELIQTARGFVPNPVSGSNGRSLGISQSQLLDSLQQVSGEEVATRGELATQVSQGQFANISGRLSALRLGSFSMISRARVADIESDPAPGPARSTVLPAQAAYSDSDSAAGGEGAMRPVLYHYSFADSTMSDSGSAAPVRGNGHASGQLSRNLGWFAEGSYNWGNRDQTANEDAFDFKAESFTAGIDYNFGSAVLGVSAGYDHYRATFADNGAVSGGDMTVKGASGSIYGAWFSDLLFVDGIVSYGQPSMDLARNVVYPSTNTCPAAASCPGENRTLTGNPDSHVYAAGVTAGHDFNIGSWDLEASVAGNYRHVKVDSFQENDTSGGGLALAYADQSIESLRSIVGLNLSRAVSTGVGVVTPNLRVEWHHEFKNEQRNLQAKYALDVTPGSSPSTFATCDSCFAIPEDRPVANFGVAGAGVSMVLPHRLQGYFFYERLVGDSHLTSNALALGIRGVF